MSDYDSQAPRMYEDYPRKDKKLSTTDLKAFLHKARKSVPFFAKHFCRVSLTNFQESIVDALKNYDSVIGLSCRGGGKSVGFSVYDTHELAFKQYPDGARDLSHLYGPIKDQSLTIFNYVEDYVEKNKVLKSFVKRHKVGGTLKFKNDNEFIARTASPTSKSKSKHPNKIQLDESQDITDEKYYEELLPSGAAKGARLQETGTPAGRNHFWFTWHEEETYKRVEQLTWKLCPYMMPGYCMVCGNTFKMVNPLPKTFKCPHCGAEKRQYDYVLRMRDKMPQKKFQQEFNCKWNINKGMVWPYSLIRKMMVLGDMNQLYYPDFQYFAGVDVAKSPAETVVSVGYAKGDELEQCYIRRIADIETWPEIEKIVYETLIIFQPWTCVDATKGSQGNVLHDNVKKKCEDTGYTMLAQKMDPVQYSDTLKVEMADQVDIMGSNSRLRLMDNDGQRRQMIAYKQKATSHGRTTFYSEPGVLSDIPQAVMLMTKAFLDHHGSNQPGTGFSYAMGSSVGGRGFKQDNTFLKQIQSAKRPE